MENLNQQLNSETAEVLESAIAEYISRRNVWDSASKNGEPFSQDRNWFLMNPSLNPNAEKTDNLCYNLVNDLAYTIASNAQKTYKAEGITVTKTDVTNYIHDGNITAKELLDSVVDSTIPQKIQEDVEQHLEAEREKQRQLAEEQAKIDKLTSAISSLTNMMTQRREAEKQAAEDFYSFVNDAPTVREAKQQSAEKSSKKQESVEHE